MRLTLGNGELWLGDCLELMKQIPSGSVDMIITSPPYDNLRTYSGMDFTSFRAIAQEMTRLLRIGAVIVWNVSDAVIKGSESGTSFRQALYFKDACGLNIHDTMIWEKPHFANPSNNRCHQVFEYMFVFSKGKPKTFNKIKDVPVKYGKPWGKLSKRHRNGNITNEPNNVEKKEWGSRTNIWKINTCGQNKEPTELHPAMFPVQLAYDHIISWSNPNDIVLDTFSGSGTTAIAAERAGRRWICMEKEDEYYWKSAERISKELNPCA